MIGFREIIGALCNLNEREVSGSLQLRNSATQLQQVLHDNVTSLYACKNGMKS
jgi:hypothetical protein